MMEEALWWFLLNLFSLVMLSFYSMSEMACVSFNKVRLHYYISQHHKGAMLIHHLLQNPAKLFGTTLIGVNVAMFCGSEFSRQFHEALGINPDWAPLSQVIIVVIFGELAPMFAARRYPERISLFSAPILWLSTKVMTPFLWGIEGITKLAQHLVGANDTSSNIFLSQEELQTLVIEKEDRPTNVKGEEFNTIVSNIFALHILSVERLMTPLSGLPTIPHHYTVGELRLLMKKSHRKLFLIYNKSPKNIVGIAIPRQLLRLKDEQKVIEKASQPWFITQNADLSVVLRQFRTNKQNVAVVLNAQGRAIGILHLDDLIRAIFTTKEPLQEWRSSLPHIEKTVNGSMTVKEFNAAFPIPLKAQETTTLDELCYEHLGHHPEEGETLFLSPYTLEIKESSLLEVKTLVIRTKK